VDAARQVARAGRASRLITGRGWRRTLTGVDQEERIALFLDYENLAIGARDHLGGMAFELRPVADALA